MDTIWENPSLSETLPGIPFFEDVRSRLFQARQADASFARYSVQFVPVKRSGFGIAMIEFFCDGKRETPPFAGFHGIQAASGDPGLVSMYPYANFRAGYLHSYDDRPALSFGSKGPLAGSRFYFQDGIVSRGSVEDEPLIRPAISLRDGTKVYRICGHPARLGMYADAIGDRGFASWVSVPGYPSRILSDGTIVNESGAVDGPEPI